MRGSRGLRAFVTIALAATTWSAAPAPVAAECTGFDRWPSFTEAAGTAKRILVGEVVESYFDDSADAAILFRVQVYEVLRGPWTTALEFHDVVRSGGPIEVCRDSILRVRVEDILAFAFDARVSDSPDPVLAVAWIRGAPDEFLMPGAETLTIARVRELAGVPPADPLPDTAPSPEPAVWPLVVAALAAVVLLVRVRSKAA